MNTYDGFLIKVLKSPLFGEGMSIEFHSDGKYLFAGLNYRHKPGNRQIDTWFLGDLSGIGLSPDEAAYDLIKQANHKTIVFGAFGEDRHVYTPDFDEFLNEA